MKLLLIGLFFITANTLVLADFFGGYTSFNPFNNFMDPFKEIERNLREQAAAIQKTIQSQRQNMPGAPKIGPNGVVIFDGIGSLSAQKWEQSSDNPNDNTSYTITNDGETVFVRKNAVDAPQIIKPVNNIINLVRFTEKKFSLTLRGIPQGIQVWLAAGNANQFGLN